METDNHGIARRSPRQKKHPSNYPGYEWPEDSDPCEGRDAELLVGRSPDSDVRLLDQLWPQVGPWWTCSNSAFVSSGDRLVPIGAHRPPP